MMRSDPRRGEPRDVVPCGVADVVLPPIGRMAPSQAVHEPVARDPGDVDAHAIEKQRASPWTTAVCAILMSSANRAASSSEARPVRRDRQAPQCAAAWRRACSRDEMLETIDLERTALLLHSEGLWRR